MKKSNYKSLYGAGTGYVSPYMYGGLGYGQGYGLGPVPGPAFGY